MTKSSPRAGVVKVDVSDPSAVAALFDAASRAFGPVGALVNNSGVMKLARLAATDDASFDQHVSVNLKGVFNCLREGARRMGEGGRIVSFSSSVVGLYQPTCGVYAATKAAVEAMTHTLAKELGPKGIAVNAIAPGPVATKLFLDGKSDEQVQTVTKIDPDGPAWRARRHRRRGLIPVRSRCALGYRASTARQWRRDLRGETPWA